MTETNVERLVTEAIEGLRDYKNGIQIESAALQTYLHIVIEQAERAPELQKSQQAWEETARNYLDENLRLREALKFYAEKDHYQVNVIAEWGPFMEVLRDDGLKARQALEVQK